LKKYTLQVKVLDGSVTANGLRVAIENILLRLHPRITYHLGLISNFGPNYLLAEIASDGKKELLESYLNGIQDKLPVHVEQLGWGWIVKDAMELSKNQASRQSGVNAQSFLLNRHLFPLIYILSIGLIFVLILLLVARFYFAQSLFLDTAFQVVFIVWLFSTGEIPLDFRLYVQRIDCEPAELAITYSFKTRTVRVNWETIEGLEHRNMLYIIYRRDNKPVRFYVSHGFKEKHAMLAAITQRASLNEVESGISKAVYRRYEAS
jgi:hypothetical protein